MGCPHVFSVSATRSLGTVWLGPSRLQSHASQPSKLASYHLPRQVAVGSAQSLWLGSHVLFPSWLLSAPRGPLTFFAGDIFNMALSDMQLLGIGWSQEVPRAFVGSLGKGHPYLWHILWISGATHTRVDCPGWGIQVRLL